MMPSVSPHPIQVQKTVGFGDQEVYVFFYPSQQSRMRGLGLALTGPHKIGAAPAGALVRVRDLSAGSPEVAVIALIIRCEDASAVERAFHARFKDRRIKGEWFNIQPDDVEEAWMEMGRPDTASLGEMLRFYRRQAGLTQTELAGFAATRQEMISKIEQGHGGVRLDTIENIANELGLRVTLVRKDSQVVVA